MVLACLSVLLAWLAGGLLGMIAALQGRWLDRVLIVIADVLLSVPGLLLLTLVVTVSGRGYLAAVIASILVMFPDIFRLVRAATLQQLQQDYVDMARCRGESLMSILLREIAPNLLPLFSADIGIRLLAALFILATASFLGLAAPQPEADWGLMIMENRQGLSFQPWATLAPIAAILLLLIPLNLSLDGLFTPSRKQNRQKMLSVLSHSDTTGDVSMALDIKHFSLMLPTQTLINSLSLQVKTGEIVALVGASGSGKSTLLRAALGHFPATVAGLEGEIWLAGRAVFSLHDRALRQLRAHQTGFVPQDPRLSMMPSQTIETYLRIMATRRGLPAQQRKQQVAAHFKELGLPDGVEFLQRYPHQISGGQRQRVMVVAAMLGYPALLLMDEPTSALDSVNTQALLRWIASTARAHSMSVLFIAHDLPQACQIADRIVVMSQGKVTEQQQTQAFLRSPSSLAGLQLLEACKPELLALTEEYVFSPLLSGSSIKASYAGRTALESLEFSIGVGEALTVAGRSGGGKTTLLRALAGLQPAASGVLTLHDGMLPLNIHQRSRVQKSKMQYVAQNPASALNPFYRVRALLLRPLRLNVPTLTVEQREQRLHEVLQQVGLETHLLSRTINTLSGGQQQRVALARALIVRPDILLCDEVTSAVDGPTRLELVKLLQRLQREQGIALLIVTHDLTLPAQLGGELMVLDHGKVIESGRASQLLKCPAHKVTRQLVAAAKLTTDISQ
ncbi:ATP-binding cassette domain-containing protein [Enterobacteriaceae bacterium RIT697]|nr:ATP-binding cassette domain-containing protein [Enterobacteriaceae bacterium RIT697]